MNKFCWAVVLLLLLSACTNNKTKKEKEGNTADAVKIQDDTPEEVRVKLLKYTDFNYELISNGTVSPLLGVVC